MKLSDLHPYFMDAGGPGIMLANGEPRPRQTGIGLVFDCPCGCDTPCHVMFANPLDGSEKWEQGPWWQRTGETFETLTLSPSILRDPKKGGCGWHGFIRNGEIVNA